MKYHYFYQTRENETRDGWIQAPNRAEAYAALRKQGIRPYRVIGDDPGRWRKWVTDAAIVGIVGIACAIVAFTLLSRTGNDATAPAVRQQIQGDASVIASGVFNGWANVFDLPLDRYLAAYARPGWKAEPPLLTPDEFERMSDDLQKPVVHEENERPEYRQMRNIVAWMRDEMRAYLKSGGTVGDYLELLEERQQQEYDLRVKAAQSVERAPEGYRYATWMSVNANLRDMGIEPIDMPRDLMDSELERTEGGLR